MITYKTSRKYKNTTDRLCDLCYLHGVYRRGWTVGSLLKTYRHMVSRISVAFDNGEPVALALLIDHKKLNQYKIHFLSRREYNFYLSIWLDPLKNERRLMVYVKPGYRKCGIGTRLIRNLELAGRITFKQGIRGTRTFYRKALNS
jgi:GNAT superfamily N-acetyltransferase